MPQILKSNFEIFISKWPPQKKDVKNLELWILISWDGAMVDYFDLKFSNTFHDSYAWINFHFLCQNPFKFQIASTPSSKKFDLKVNPPLFEGGGCSLCTVVSLKAKTQFLSQKTASGQSAWNFAWLRAV